MYRYGELPYDPTVVAMWSHVRALCPDRDFVVSSAGDGSIERITYGEVERQSAEMSSRLLAGGVTKGTRVGILAPNGPHFVVALLAVTRIGAVAVPINTFFQPPELGWLIRHADLQTILATPMLLGRSMLARLYEAVPGLGDHEGGPIHLPGTPHLRNVLPLVEPDEQWPMPWPSPLGSDMVEAAERTVRPADDLVVIYTSGSTADPKGVIHSHGPVVRHSQFIAAGHEWSQDDRVYVPMAFFWIGGLVFGLLGPMQIGVTILTEHRFEPGDVLRLLAAEKATYATGFPHVGPALANHPDFVSTDLSSLRDGYQQILLPADRRTPDPTLRVFTLGMTETCSSHTWWPPGVELPESKRGSLGTSGPGFEHKIVDESGLAVADGVVGEVCVRGDALARGMVGRSRSEVFDQEGWYHTGDSAYRDSDGHLYFAGRTDDMVKTSGANVAPVEVESVLNSLPEVREAYVIGLPDPDKGAIVTAVVVLNSGRTLTPERLTAECRQRLSAYKVPKRWEILPDAASLPYTTTNKIDKRALAEQLAKQRKVT